MFASSHANLRHTCGFLDVKIYLRLAIGVLAVSAAFASSSSAFKKFCTCFRNLGHWDNICSSVSITLVGVSEWHNVGNFSFQHPGGGLYRTNSRRFALMGIRRKGVTLLPFAGFYVLCN